MKKLIIAVIIGVVFTVSVIVYVFMQKSTQQSSAAAGDMINTQDLTDTSTVKKDAGTVFFDLYTAPNNEQGVAPSQNNDTSLFNTSTKNDTAILEFIKKSPRVPKNLLEKGSNSNVKGVSFTSGDSNFDRLLPANFSASLIRRSEDKDDLYLQKVAPTKENEVHHYYNQTINGKPVLGGVLAVHAVDNRILAATASLVSDQTVESTSITEEQAKNKALEQARIDSEQHPIELMITDSKQYVFNYKILHFSDDVTNYPSLAVTVSGKRDVDLFLKRYYVDLHSGKLLFTEELLQDIANVNVYDCSNGGCSLAKSSDSQQSSDTEVSNAYDFLKKTLEYYQNSHTRNSYDGNGSAVNANIHFSQGISCPNAFWNGRVNVCTGMATQDVLSHEMTHGVTQTTAGLVYSQQSGALNESFSDIFAYAVTNSWSIGVGSVMGEIRRLDDPTNPRPSNPAYKRPQPDKLFSQYYYCGSSDNGGVHINSGVLNYAFYLMTAGGTFNGCTITGVGRDKTVPIMYRTLTTYLTSSSNMSTTFNAVKKACDDLFSPDACAQVTAAMQATEMDQTPIKCANGTEKPATCSNGATIAPTTSVSPTGTGTTTPTITASPTAAVTPNPQPTIVVTKSTATTNTVSINVSVTASTVKAFKVQKHYKDSAQGSYSAWEDLGIFAAGQAIQDSAIDKTKIYQYQVRSCSDTACQNFLSDYVLTSEIVYDALPATNPTATPVPSATPSGPGITLKLKFQGIQKKPVSVTSWPVKIKMVADSSGRRYESTVNFTVDDNGVWSAKVPVNGFQADRYMIYIKGPKHIQKKVCDITPTESIAGTYHCKNNEGISLATANQTLDFTGILQLVGDLPEQDGVVNAYDISQIVNCISTPSDSCTQKADLNLDSKVDAQDYSLVIAALAIRFDED